MLTFETGISHSTILPCRLSILLPPQMRCTMYHRFSSGQSSSRRLDITERTCACWNPWCRSFKICFGPLSPNPHIHWPLSRHCAFCVSGRYPCHRGVRIWPSFSRAFLDQQRSKPGYIAQMCLPTFLAWDILSLLQKSARPFGSGAVFTCPSRGKCQCSFAEISFPGLRIHL